MSLMVNSTATTSPTSGASTPAEGSLPTTSRDGFIQFTPKRAIASFENLVAMANHQERLREAKKMVWRDRGQPVVELDTLEACLEHAFTGGLRSATLAYNIRAAVNLILALIRIHRVPRDNRLAVIRHAVFGTDSLRFAAMLGTFTSLYKFLINALPILIPALNLSRSNSAFDDDDEGASMNLPTTTVEVPLARRSARLSLSTRAQLMIIRKQTRRWHAALAGAVAGGLAIMWEKKGRKDLIAQQLFVRGLQGSWNAFTFKRGIKVPYGDVLVFALFSGQILYAFLLRPDTLPRSYSTWYSIYFPSIYHPDIAPPRIGQAAKVPLQCVPMNMSLVRDGTLDVNGLEAIAALPDTTPFNKADLFKVRDQFLNGFSPSEYFPWYAPCSAVHPAISSCANVPLDRFFAVFKWMLPIYGALHFVPAVVFRRKVFMQDPGKVLVKAGLGSIRSSAFLGTFVVIYQTMFCYKHKLHKYLTLLKIGAVSKPTLNPLKSLPQWVVDILISKMSFWLPGFAAGLSLFVEEKRRRGELAMYVLPKGLESMWVMARGKGWVFRTGKWGEALLAALGMAMVMSTYQNDPQHLSGLVRRILYQFIGPN